MPDLFRSALPIMRQKLQLESHGKLRREITHRIVTGLIQQRRPNLQLCDIRLIVARKPRRKRYILKDSDRPLKDRYALLNRG